MAPFCYKIRFKKKKFQKMILIKKYFYKGEGFPDIYYHENFYVKNLI